MEIASPGTPIIIDIGSAYIKIGFAGDAAPKYIFPCITGTEKYKSVMADVETRGIYIGDDAMKMRGVLKVKHPIVRGIIQDWDDYYEILNHIFYTLLRLENLSFYPIIYADAPFVQRETREYIARVLFETHKSESLIMVPSPLLSIFSIGLTTGLVIESGDGTTWIVPIINGQIYYQAVQRLSLGGYDVNQNLMALLMREGIMVSSSASVEIFREIKEKNCYFVLDPNNPPALQEDLIYTMPDGSTVAVPGRFLYEAPEVMFQPAMLGYNIMNIPQAIIHCLQMIDSSYWGDLLTHIVLSGGNASYSGFEERLKQELTSLLPQLGQIPKPKTQIKQQPTQKLQTLKATQKKEDTCSKCGTLVDLSDGKEFCPNCGGSMVAPLFSIDLGLGKKKEKKKLRSKCPHCGKDIKDDFSIFCPYCGQNVEAFEAFEIVEEKIEQAVTTTIQEFAGYYEPSDEILKFFVPRNLHYAIFNGASVLGSLPSFRNYFVSHTQFLSDPNLLYRDISDILRQ